MKGLRLYLELAVVLGVGAFAYVKIAPRWNGFFSPLKPAEEAAPELAPSASEPGERPAPRSPSLSAPALPAGRPRTAGAGSAMLVVPESERQPGKTATYEGDPTLKANTAAPQVFERAPIAQDSLALSRPEPTSDAKLQPKWLTTLQALDPRLILAIIVGVFVVLYFVGVAALRRGPGGKGLTHD